MSLNLLSQDSYVTCVQQRGVTHRSARATAAGSRASTQGDWEVWDELLVTPDPISSNSLDNTYEGLVEQQVFQDDEDDDSQFDDAQMNLPFMDSVMPPCRGLSPLVEVSSEMASSELASADSIESIKSCHDLETELNVAMSRLSTISDELEEAVLESRQTTITETVTIGASFDRKPFSERADSAYEGWCVYLVVLVH